MESKSASGGLAPDQTEIILESISDGVFTVDHDWLVTSFNRAAEEITGIPRAEAVGRRCCEVFRASMCETDCALRRTLDTGTPVINRAAYIVNAAGKNIPVSVSTALLRDAGGMVIGGVETFRDLTLVEELRRKIEERYVMGDMVSRSAAMRRLFDILPQVAASDAPVVIEGETGTGKELLARALHNQGPRKNRPFIALNCGALPDTLLESELFGYKAGAFTGADRDKPGRFALAEGGTLFLDEIADVSPALQVRLLRVLQEKSYEPLGGARTVKADVRVITATNRPLAGLVSDGTFRRDLYYRLNVVRLELPPLRERREDIPLLAEHFIRRFNQTQGRSVNGVSAGAMALLMAHDYPGNIRELENVFEHAFVLCQGAIIGTACLPEALTGRRTHPSSAECGAFGAVMGAAGARMLLDALEQCNGNRNEAAKLLGIHKSTFFRKVRGLGLTLPKQDGRSGRLKR